MKHADDVLEAYRLTDAEFRARLSVLIAEGRDDEALRLRHRKSINDQAYLFLLVAQFEDFVTSRVSALIASGLASADWRERRVWQALAERPISRIPFLTRLALLTDRGRPEYATVKRIYDARNLIAHGTMLSVSVDPVEVATELDRIASLLQDAP